MSDGKANYKEVEFTVVGVKGSKGKVVKMVVLKRQCGRLVVGSF